MLNFKPTFSLSSFTFIKRFFSSSFHSAITVLSPALLRWLIYLPTILIPVWFIQPRISHHLLFSDLKRLPAMRETQVWFLGREDPLEKEVAIHSRTLAWKIPWTEEPDRLQSVGSPKIGHDWVTFTFTLTAFDCVDDNKLWKILQEMGLPDHFTCLLRNL